MAKLYTLSHLVLIRDDEEAQSRNWVTDQEDFLIRNLGRGRWSVRAIDVDGSMGMPVYLRTAELERRYLRRLETYVKVYKA